MSQQLELQLPVPYQHHHYHHHHQQQQQRQQQQHWSHMSGDYDVNNTSSLTSLPADEYAALWFGWSAAVNCSNESSQHSSSGRR